MVRDRKGWDLFHLIFSHFSVLLPSPRLASFSPSPHLSSSLPSSFSFSPCLSTSALLIHPPTQRWPSLHSQLIEIYCTVCVCVCVCEWNRIVCTVLLHSVLCVKLSAYLSGFCGPSMLPHREAGIEQGGAVRGECNLREWKAFRKRGKPRLGRNVGNEVWHREAKMNWSELSHRR